MQSDFQIVNADIMEKYSGEVLAHCLSKLLLWCKGKMDVHISFWKCNSVFVDMIFQLILHSKSWHSCNIWT